MSLTIENLRKTYANNVQAMQDVTLEIPPGMFGLLGPNGAGKSTLMNTLATLQEPDSGTIRLGELDALREPQKVRARLGYLPQEFGVYPHTSGVAMLDYFAQLKGIADAKARRNHVQHLLELVNLSDAAHRNVDSYSGGMKQRWGVAQALLGNPQLVIVDEPTAGLDPAERHRFHNILSEIGEETVVLLSTHIVEDVANLCSRMAIMNGGRIVAQGTPQELTQSLRGQLWQTRHNKAEAKVELERLRNANSSTRVLASRLSSGQVVTTVYAPQAPGPDYFSKEPDLEDVYFFYVPAGEN